MRDQDPRTLSLPAVSSDWCQALTLAASVPDPLFLHSGCTTAQFRSSKLPHSLGAKVFSWKVGSVSKDHKDWDPGRIHLSHHASCCLLRRNWTASACTRNGTAIVINPTISKKKYFAIFCDSPSLACFNSHTLTKHKEVWCIHLMKTTDPDIQRHICALHCV